MLICLGLFRCTDKNPIQISKQAKQAKPASKLSKLLVDKQASQGAAACLACLLASLAKLNEKRNYGDSAVESHIDDGINNAPS